MDKTNNESGYAEIVKIESVDGIERGDTVYVPVTSSTVEAVAYVADEKKLLVKFKNGSRYSYTSVPEHVFKLFLIAGSKGKFFDQNIRKNAGYTCVKLGGPATKRAM